MKAAQESISALTTSTQRRFYNQLESLIRREDTNGALRLLNEWEHPDDAVTDGYRTLCELTMTGHTDRDVVEIARGVLAHADTFFEADDLDSATAQAALALDVLFHRELHSDVVHSPLVDDPETFLAPLRESVVGGELVRPSARRRPPRAMANEQIRVKMTPGPFNDFHIWVAQALDAVPHVETEVLDRDPKRGFNTLNMDPGIIRARLEYSKDRAVSGYESVAATLRDADVVFVDWADKLAVLASILAPPTARIVVRLHSVDFLRAWLHLIDWSRVDRIICLSDAMAALTRSLLTDSIDGVEVRVIRNEAPRGLSKPKAPHARRTLGLIGWAKRVKDPLWALDILAPLVAEDPSWRLVVIGPGFSQRPSASGVQYECAFWERAQAADIRDHIIYTGYTDDVSVYLQEIGFILSTSRRESFHRAVLEGTLSGAVPVVRNWPMFSRHGAAESVYPSEWVIEDIDGAVARIQEHANEESWTTASREAKQAMTSLTDLADLAADYQSAVLAFD